MEENKLDKAIAVAGWWAKNKNRIYGVGLLIFGALGGNIDRIDEFLPKSDVPAIEARLDAAETNINTLFRAVEDLSHKSEPTEVTHETGFKVEK